jgi:DNA-binding NarL/FixJ family response regulator
VRSSDVVLAVEAVARGERLLEEAATFASPPRSSRSRTLPAKITPRELEVLARVAAGEDNLKIAMLLGITERTVKAHVGALYQKLGMENRVQLALLARDLGVVFSSGGLPEQRSARVE